VGQAEFSPEYHQKKKKKCGSNMICIHVTDVNKTVVNNILHTHIHVFNIAKNVQPNVFQETYFLF
jgi:hypothetical protein